MTAVEPATLAYYTQPDVMTGPGRHAALFSSLPHDVAALAAVTQGLIVHEYWAGAYGLTLSDADRATAHLRRAEDLLEHIVARDGRPLSVARDAAHRLVGNCRMYTVLLVAMLRFQGVPARARCGFARYFADGFGEDHWVCEYWDSAAGRWVLVDAQIDALQRGQLKIDFNLTDVPRDQFLVAGEVWRRYRTGQADPDRYGLSVIGEGGAWWVAGNLMRDAAALTNRELLPWDTWGAMPGPYQAIDEDLVSLFDRLAALTLHPDDSLDELRTLLRDDPRLAVPAQVHNELRGRDEPL